MVEEVGGDPARVVPVLPEAEEAVGVPGPGGCVAQPHLPVHEVVALSVRSRVRIDRPVPLSLVGVAVVGALAHEQLADHPVLDGLASLPPLVGAGRLRADLQHAAGLLHGGREVLGLFHRVGDGLLEVDVLVLAHRLEGHAGVPVVGGGDDDRVHVGAVQHLPVVERGVALGELGRLVLAPGVDVADRHHLGGQRGIGRFALPGAGSEDRRGGLDLATGLHDPAQEVRAATPGADEGHVDAVVGAEDAGVGGSGAAEDAQAHARPHRRLHELTAVQLVVTHASAP